MFLIQFIFLFVWDGFVDTLLFLPVVDGTRRRFFTITCITLQLLLVHLPYVSGQPFIYIIVMPAHHRYH
jgi:hypothetical protein